MIRFTKAKGTPRRPPKPRPDKNAALNRLKSFLTAAEPEVVEIVVSCLQGQTNAITYKELRECYLAGGITDKQFTQWQKDYSQLITSALAHQWQKAAAAGAQQVKDRYPCFVYEPAVSAGMDFIKLHGAELVTNLAAEQREALNAVIAHVSGYTAVTPDEAARIIRPCVGLTKPQALANARYREAVKQAFKEANPHSRDSTAEKKAAEAAARYAARQHRYRAQNIARTELAYAYNAGHYGATKDAQAQGYIGDCVKVWLTAYDERVCQICSAMDDEKRNMDEMFSNGKMLPPGHPSCRCAVAYEEIPNTHLTSQRRQGTMDAQDMREPGDAMRGIATDDRSMAMGFRKPAVHILTDDEIASIEADARAIEIPTSVLSFNTGRHTGFVDDLETINIRGDILPDLDSTIARDRMSQRAVLAHEYYGHYKHHPSEYDIGDWRDEFRASYDAAVKAPNLTDEERALLMVDAYDRAKEAGVMLEYDEMARRIIYGY